MAEERRLVIPGVLERVLLACDFVAEAANTVGLDDRASYHCQMAVDEWCTNIIEHGYGGGGDDYTIELILRLQPAQLTMIVADESAPFDPTTLPAPDTNSPLENREPGGLGWYFITKTMNAVHYAYKNGHNVLTMVKRGEGERVMPETPTPFTVYTTDDGVLVMAPVGRVDSSVGRQLEAALTSQISAGQRRIVVDMDGVTYISSTGLKALLSALRRLQALNGGITLAGLKPRVQETFEMSGFDTLFIIKPTAQDAVAALLSA